MKLLACTLLIISLMISESSYAQNCKQLNEWTQSVDNEFSDVDFSRLRSGSEIYNRIRYNLLSDKYFVPMFKTPFDQISQSKRNYINSMINKCSANKINKGGVSESRLNFYMWGVFGQTRAYEEAAKKVKEIRSLRNEYNHAVDVIKSKNLTFSELNGYKNFLSTKYSILLPSEVDYLSELIFQREGEIANYTLLATASSTTEMENSLLTLKKLHIFESTNQVLFDKADSSVKGQAVNIIEKKIDDVLSFLVGNENDKIENIVLNEGGIEKINNLYSSIFEDYGSFQEHYLVLELFDKIKHKKTQIVTNIYNDINLKIINSQRVKELENIEAIYLSNVSANNPKILEISHTVSEKIQKINDKERQAEITRIEEQKTREQEKNRNQYEVINKGYFEGKYSRSDFWFPGAIDLLAKGDISNFPDPLESRRWLFHFYTTLTGGGRKGLPGEVYSSEFQLKLIAYLTSMKFDPGNSFGDLILSKEEKFGLMDAKMIIENNHYEDLNPIIKSAILIISRNSGKDINPHAKYGFFSLGSQKLLNELNIKEEDVAKYRPGFKDSWDLLKEKIVSKVNSEDVSDKNELRYSDLHGSWLDTLYSSGSEPINLRIYFQFHQIHQEMSGIVIQGDSEFIPTIIFRGSKSFEISLNSKNTNFKKLFVGRLSPDGKTLTGWIYHYKLGDTEYQVTFHKRD